jgi:hypothetical protein
MQGTKKIVSYDRTSPDFDNVVNLGSTSLDIKGEQIFRGILQCSPESEIVLTMPSASALIKACPVIPCAGYCKRFSIRNDGRAAATLVCGEGGSFNGSDTVSASNYASHYVLRFTSVTSGVEAYQIIRE